MNKKNYIKPIATVFACNTESLLVGYSTKGSNNTGSTTEQKPSSGGSTSNSGLFGSKDNSGLLDWDDEEE